MRWMVQGLGVALTALVVGTSPAVVEAQDPPGSAEEAGLRGVVLDGRSGQGVASAFVVLADEGRGVITDARGRFRGLEVAPGAVALEVRALGYGQELFFFSLEEAAEELEIILEPDPVLLEGITVMHDRIRSRRRAVGVSARSFDEERLQRSAAFDVVEFLRMETPTTVVPCGGRGGSCVIARGRMVEPEVYIDEIRAFGGLSQLQMYRPWELHLVETYAGGRQIRAYTVQFMEQLARRPQALLPIFAP